MSRSVATVLLTIMTAVVATNTASAAEQSLLPPLPQVTVTFGDLRTSTPEGIRELYARIRSAASEVCLKQPAWYPTEYWTQQDCYRHTLNNVVLRLNLPRLTALHRASTRELPG